MLRCPNATVSRTDLAVISAVLMTERGILPDSGGWHDQAAAFVAAFPLVCDEIASWREVHRRIAMRNAQKK